MINKGRRIYLLAAMLLLLSFSSCTCENPLSGLEWGEGTAEGYVLARHIYPDGRILVEQVENVVIRTDVGNESTITDQDGWYSLKVRFRIGRTANTKKVKLTAERDDLEDRITSDEVLLVDGQSTLATTMYWEVKH